MKSSAIIVPVIPAGISQVSSNVSDAMKRSGHKAVLSGRKTVTAGERYLAEKAWVVIYTVLSNIVPEDAYDWDTDDLEDAA